MARRFQFPFFSVGKNFCHSRTLNRKDSELDELSFFFLVDGAQNNLRKHGEILLLGYIINHLPFPFFRHFAIHFLKYLPHHDLGDKFELPRD